MVTFGLLGVVLLASQAGAQVASPNPEKPGAALYQKLASAGLDAAKVYSIRDAGIDKEDLHITMDDGTIALLEAVDGRVTGALFVGDGSVLLVPPSQQERQSLELFTGAAVLSEHFTLAYFRFADDGVLKGLQPMMRPAEEPQAFLDEYAPIAKSLAAGDALRLLVAQTRESFPSGERGRMPAGGFLRARLSGAKLGIFDVVVDALNPEQIFAGQVSYHEKGRYYDQWTSFPMRSARAENAAEPDVVEVKGYEIRTALKPPTDLSATATLDLTVNRGGDRTVIFELSRFLGVSQATWQEGGREQPLEFIQNQAIEGTQLARRGNDLVAVIFPRPLREGERLKLTLTYSGAVMSDAGSGLVYVGAKGTWYPNRGPAMAEFRLEFRYPPGWTLLATGKRVSAETEGSGQVARWASEVPVPLAGFNLGKYAEVKVQSASGVSVEAYAARGMETEFKQPTTVLVAPSPDPRRLSRRPSPADMMPLARPDPQRNAKTVAELSAHTVDFLTPRLGPFPYQTLALTQMPGSDSQGWPGLVFLSSYAFLSSAERTRGRGREAPSTQILYDRLMTAHETAHQWWGNEVFWASYRDQWLMEALANYSALLELEAESPEEFRTMMGRYREELLRESQDGGEKKRPMKDAGAVTLGLRLNSALFPDGYDVVAYGRGTWLIHMLRMMFHDAAEASSKSAPARRAGTKKAAPLQPAVAGPGPDDVFLSVLRDVLLKFRGKALATGDLQAALEKALPKSLWYEDKPSLDWFFQGWVNGTALPKLRLDEVRIAKKGNSTVATAVLRQSNAPEQLVTSVPVYAQTATGQLVFVARVYADGDESDVKVSVPAGTRGLALDPFKTVLTAK